MKIEVADGWRKKENEIVFFLNKYNKRESEYNLS